jgi:hypothetical protein
MEEMLCIHICKWKDETCWNYSRNEGKEDKATDGGGEFICDIL